MTKVLQRPITVVLVAAVLGGLVASMTAWRTPQHQEVSISFAVNRVNASPSAEYQYDGYYAIQAADLFSQTVVSWFSTPSVIREVYDQAGISIPDSELNRYVGRFKTKKYAAQNIVVTFREDTPERARSVGAAVSRTMQERASALNQTSERTSLFEVVGSTPVIATQQPNPALAGLIGFVAGLLFGIAVVSVASYLNSLATAQHGHRD